MMKQEMLIGNLQQKVTLDQKKSINISLHKTLSTWFNTKIGMDILQLTNLTTECSLAQQKLSRCLSKVLKNIGE